MVMKKRLTIVIASLVFLLILGANTNSVSAADYSNVGVAVGDTAYYAVSLTFSDDTNLLLLVHGIVGTVVTLNLTWYLVNGTISSEHQVVGDIATGSNFIWLYLIASGLQANDAPTSVASYSFNSTGPEIIGGAIRSVNHVSIPDWNLDQKYDQVSGFLLQSNVVVLFSWFNLTMLDTSFGNPFLRISSIVVIVGVVVVLIVAAVILRRRGGKSRRRRKKKK
jgi:hypothetical protein